MYVSLLETFYNLVFVCTGNCEALLNLHNMIRLLYNCGIILLVLFTAIPIQTINHMALPPAGSGPPSKDNVIS